MMDLYGKGLANIHDIGFGDFSLKAGPALLEILRKRGITDGLVVDLGCGSGIWADQLVRGRIDLRRTCDSPPELVQGI